jgi:hypothetical protein
LFFVYLKPGALYCLGVSQGLVRDLRVYGQRQIL